jgi:hypothetical protein
LTSKNQSNIKFRAVLCLALPGCAAATQGQEGPPPSTGVGLIQLAINSSSYSMAEAAAAVALKYPAALEPDVARKLLLTAATRGHTAALEILAFSSTAIPGCGHSRECA